MTWEYVAGFFDGEGCVRYQHAKWAMKATIVQSTKQHQVLYDIQAFLIAHNVRSNIRPAATSYVAKDGRICCFSTLAICDAASLAIFYTHILPFVIVKRQKVAEGLLLAQEVEDRKRQRQNAVDARLQECLKLYSSGVSAIQAVRRTHVGKSTFAKYLAENKIPTRSHREAGLLAFRKH